jgi:hypothetical protein
MGSSKQNPHRKHVYISENVLFIGISFLEPNIIHVVCILAKNGALRTYCQLSAISNNRPTIF